MLVIKIGGAAGIDTQAICQDLAALWRAGRTAVLVHGGSDETNSLAEQLGHPPRFVTSVSGHTSRLTDRRTLEIFTMATAALNRRLVAQLQQLGINALGLSGLDGRLIQAQRKAAIRVVENGRQRVVRDDWTGTPEQVNGQLLRSLIEGGYLPVIAPLAISREGEPLNIDGDRGAAAIAGSLGAETLLLLTNVRGLLRHYPDESTLIRSVGREALEDLIGSTEGRMRKKLLGAQEALRAGVRQVIIADGRNAAPITSALAGEGTSIE